MQTWGLFYKYSFGNIKEDLGLSNLWYLSLIFREQGTIYPPIINNGLKAITCTYFMYFYNLLCYETCWLVTINYILYMTLYSSYPNYLSFHLVYKSEMIFSLRIHKCASWFLSLVYYSHELRTPMAAVIGLLDILISHD